MDSKVVADILCSIAATLEWGWYLPSIAALHKTSTAEGHSRLAWSFTIVSSTLWMIGTAFLCLAELIVSLVFLRMVWVRTGREHIQDTERGEQ